LTKFIAHNNTQVYLSLGRQKNANSLGHSSNYYFNLSATLIKFTRRTAGMEHGKAFVNLLRKKMDNSE